MKNKYKIMDQFPFEFNLILFLHDIDELLTLLETDKDKWGWLINELNKQLEQQVKEKIKNK